MKQFTSTILINKQITEDYYLMTLDWDRQEGKPEPGQFFTIRSCDSSHPLLRRPFAVSGYSKAMDTASFIFQRRGPATQNLALARGGEQVDIMGLFGEPFPYPGPGQRAILVAGGIGLGPVLYFASLLKQEKRPYLFAFGGRNASCIPDLEELNKVSPQICTDDGSLGFSGTTIDYLNTLPAEEWKNSVLYACGPHPMLKGCHELALKHDIPCWVSLEEIMACGVGACMGCVVKEAEGPGYLRVCKEGPIFDSRRVAWD